MRDKFKSLSEEKNKKRIWKNRYHNMSEEKKQRLKEHQKEYQKNYNKAKKLLRIMHKEATKKSQDSIIKTCHKKNINNFFVLCIA